MAVICPSFTPSFFLPLFLGEHRDLKQLPCLLLDNIMPWGDLGKWYKPYRILSVCEKSRVLVEHTFS